MNKQDAFQVQYCLECRKEARKEAAKAKRAEKRVEGKSVEDIQAEIAQIEEQMAELS